MSILEKIEEQGYKVNDKFKSNYDYEVKIEGKSFETFYMGTIFLNMLIVKVYNGFYKKETPPEVVELDMYQYWKEKAQSLNKILIFTGFEQYLHQSEENYVVVSEKLLNQRYYTFYVQKSYENEIHVFEPFIVSFRKVMKDIVKNVSLFKGSATLCMEAKMKGFYFSSNVMFELEVKHNQCYLSVYENHNKENDSILLTTPKDIKKEVMDFLDKKKKSNRVHYLMNKEKHFFASFCKDKKISEIMDDLYDELTNHYTSLKIEELSWDYMKLKRKDKQMPIKFKNKFHFFSFHDHYFLADMVQYKVCEVIDPTQEKIQEAMFELYKGRIKEEFECSASKLEKWDIW